MTAVIIVRLRVEGIHCWPECPFESVAFLRAEHRHEFHIVAFKGVTHLDRDVEIIMLKRAITDFLRLQFGAPCQFGRMSCETIAALLVEQFGLAECEVSEDGENGAVVTP
tara:strand:- start:1755 stop:2084 length:330 start_codon:yes stop_codon:yes gene_type:complete